MHGAVMASCSPQGFGHLGLGKGEQGPFQQLWHGCFFPPCKGFCASALTSTFRILRRGTGDELCAKASEKRKCQQLEVLPLPMGTADDACGTQTRSLGTQNPPSLGQIAPSIAAGDAEGSGARCVGTSKGREQARGTCQGPRGVSRLAAAVSPSVPGQ